MLTKPQVYQDGISNPTITGVILMINGVPLQGNVETAFTDGHIYNTITNWSGIPASLDPLNNTYTKSVVTFTFSNAIGNYRTDADGNEKRVSDDITANRVGARADIYFVNNIDATALSDCLHPFVDGTVKTISDYDESTITITLDSKSVAGKTKILNTQLKDLFDEDDLADIGKTLFDEHKDTFIPKVYGDFSQEGQTGLVKGYRINSEIQPWFVFSDHRMKEVNSLYISPGKGLKVGENEECEIIPYGHSPEGYNDTYDFESIVFNMDTDAIIIYRLDKEIAGAFKDKYYQPTAGAINDNDVLSTAKIVVNISNSGQANQEPREGYIGWNIFLPHDFKKQFKTGRPGAGCLVSHANFYAPRTLDRGWKLIYNQDVDSIYYLKMGGDTPSLQPNTTDHPEVWYDTEPVYYADIEEPDKIDRNFVLTYYTNVFGLGNGEKTPVELGEARLVLKYPWAKALREGTIKLEEAWAACMGRTYGPWIETFGTHNFTGRLIDTGAGIMTSLLVDELGWTADDFDITSFNRCLFNGIKMRLNITDEDDTLDKIATRLGKQSPWTFFISPAGQAKLITLRKVWSDETVEATITYDEMSKSPKIGLTDEHYIKNDIIIKSRWFAERGKFDNEQAYKNASSISQYKPRKKTIECKNIDSAEVGEIEEE